MCFKIQLCVLCSCVSNLQVDGSFWGCDMWFESQMDGGTKEEFLEIDNHKHDPKK